MRMLVLATLLAGLSAPATAEWIAIGEDAEAVYYADLSTKRKNGDFVKMWIITDFKMPMKAKTSKPTRSVRAQEEYDCKEEQSRTLYVSLHTLNRAQGDMVGSSSATREWSPIPPRTPAANHLRVACAE